MSIWSFKLELYFMWWEEQETMNKGGELRLKDDVFGCQMMSTELRWVLITANLTKPRIIWGIGFWARLWGSDCSEYINLFGNICLNCIRGSWTVLEKERDPIFFSFDCKPNATSSLKFLLAWFPCLIPLQSSIVRSINSFFLTLLLSGYFIKTTRK